jgi:hypothetical protein
MKKGERKEKKYEIQRKTEERKKENGMCKRKSVQKTAGANQY